MAWDLSTYRRELEAQGYSRRTVGAKIQAVALAAAHADTDPVELTRDDLLAWLVDRPAPLSDWTRIKYLGHVGAFLAWAGREDVTRSIRRPPTPLGVPKPVSEVDLAAMLEVTAGRDRAFLLLGAFCGLRSFETAKVRAEDLERGADGSTLLRVVGKGGVTAVLPCPPVVVDALRATGVRSGPYWPGCTPGAVQEAVRRAARRAGVSCSSHQLRHRYGTAVHRDAGDLLLTQQLMRHRSPATTAGYARVAGTRASNVVAALPGATGADGSRARLRLVRGS